MLLLTVKQFIVLMACVSVCMLVLFLCGEKPKELVLKLENAIHKGSLKNSGVVRRSSYSDEVH